MKRLVLVLFLAALISGAAFAQGAPKSGEFGIQAALTFTAVAPGTRGDLGAKYWINNDMALRAALGFDNISAGGGSSTPYNIGVGFEYHFGGKGGVSPYAGAEFSYSGVSVSGGGTTPSDFGLMAVFGGEYFFSSNFSWAGELGLGFDSFNNTVTTTTTIGTFGFGTFLTWYIN